jgi:hypothetical protein
MKLNIKEDVTQHMENLRRKNQTENTKNSGRPPQQTKTSGTEKLIT